VNVVGDLARKHLAATLLVLVLIFGGLGWWMWRKLRTKRLDDASQAA
jgi:cbb3-type cytochrome oxidase subunit 3